MTDIKEVESYVETTTPTTRKTTAELATVEVYHDGVVLLDVGVKDAEGGEVPPLKLSKDGHVRRCISMKGAETDNFADCVGTSAIE